MNRRTAILASIAGALELASAAYGPEAIDRTGESRPVPVFRKTGTRWIEVHPRDLRKGDRVRFSNRATDAGDRVNHDSVLAEDPVWLPRERVWSAMMVPSQDRGTR